MTYVKICVIALISSMILSLVLTYAGIMTIVQTTKSNTEQVLNSFVIKNSTIVFTSIKNGSDFTTSINANEFVTAFSQSGTLDRDSSYFYNKDKNGNIVYRLTIPQTSFSVSNTLNLTCRLDALIPVYFAGEQVTELRIPIKVTSSYNIK